jgi:cell shape-determining protein MreD
MAELALLGWEMPWNDMILRNLIPGAFLNALAALLIYLPIVIFGEHREMHL